MEQDALSRDEIRDLTRRCHEREQAANTSNMYRNIVEQYRDLNKFRSDGASRDRLFQKLYWLHCSGKTNKEVDDVIKNYKKSLVKNQPDVAETLDEIMLRMNTMAPQIPTGTWRDHFQIIRGDHGD